MLPPVAAVAVIVSVCKVKLAATLWAVVTLLKVYVLLVKLTAFPSTVKLATYLCPDDVGAGIRLKVWLPP